MTDFNEKYNLKHPVCLYKWTWSTIRLMEGTTSSCHRVKSDFLRPETYKDFHNTLTKIKHREMMKRGEWPGDGCEYCRDIEASGGVSDRQEFSEDFEYVPVELENNSQETNLTPKIVEVYFNNLCNLNCIYCSGEYSTVWEAEEKKFGLRSPGDIKYRDSMKDKYPQMLEKHWEWMKENAVNTAEYRILGGEPFFQPELEQNIDFFLDNPCPDTIFTIFSNLKVKNTKMRELLDKVVRLQEHNHIKDFRLVCSLDCWGSDQEYIRTGLNMKDWEENFLTILNEYPSISLEIHGTIVSLTIQSLPELCAKISEWNKIRRVSHTINIVVGNDEMHPGIFPTGFFDEQIEQSIKNHVDPSVQKWLRGFQKRVNSQETNKKSIKQLKQVLNDIDSRRGTEWKQLWRWLDEYEV